MNALSSLDYVIVLAYLAGIAFIGLRTASRQKTTAGYFIANRQIPAFAVGFNMMATTISSVTFVAIPGMVFAKNWWLMIYMFMAAIVLIFAVMFVVPFYRRVVALSAYEYLERRFGYGARLYGSAGFMILRVTDLGFTLYLTAVAVELITGWKLSPVVVGVGMFTLLYTMFGGIEAAIWTGVVQGVILIGGALLILAILLLRPEGGPHAVLSAALEAGKFSLGNFELSWSSLFKEDATAWILMIAGLLYFGRYYITEQNMVQRYLVARTDKEAQQGVVLGVLSTVPTWTLFAVIGACLWSFYRLTGPTLPQDVTQHPDNILPFFIATQLPRGLVGLILAALLSSAMSTVSADLNSIATVATQDYFARALPQSSDRARLLFGRCAVLIGGLISTGIALLLTLTRSTAAYEIVVLSVSIVAGGMLGLFALGFLCRRATRRGAYVGIIVCVLFVAWATITGPLKVDLGINFILNPILIGVLSHFVLFGVGYVASLALGGYRPDLAGLTIWDARASPVELLRPN